MTIVSSVPGTSTVSTQDGASHRRVVRAASVACAAASTTAIFLAGHALGADFTITDPGQAAAPHTFVATEIAVITVVISLFGWLVLAGLERWTRRPAVIWGGLAVATLALSIVPIFIERATTGTRIGLVLVHLAVGLALIPVVRSAKRS